MSESNGNLLPQFIAAGIAPEELGAFLMRRFQSSSRLPESNEVKYPREAPHELTLTYDKHGALQEVHAGSGAVSPIGELIQSLKAEFIGETNPGTGAAILFCDAARVEGWWRYKDQFQIFPAPEHAPRANYVCAQHPFLMEFRYAASTNGFTNSARTERRALELTRVLNSLLNANVWLNRNVHLGTLDNMWVVLPGSLEKGRFEIAYCQRLYVIDGLRVDPRFYSSTETLAPLAMAGTHEYHNDPFSRTDTLTIPADLDDCFDHYFALDEAKRRKYLQACFWLGEMRNCRSFSLRLITAVQAIESLVEPGPVAGRCPSCNRELKDGPTKLFQSFLKKYAPIDGEETPLRKALYGTRSGLTHGHRPPFRMDTEVESSLNPLALDERRVLDNAQRLVRIALRNWLCADLAPVRDADKPLKEHFSVSTTIGQLEKSGAH